MARWRELVTIEAGGPNETEVDIRLESDTPPEILQEQMGILSKQYDEMMTVYMKEVEISAKAQATASKLRGQWDASEQIFIAQQKKQIEGRGPSLDSLRGMHKESEHYRHEDVLESEEDAAARHIMSMAMRSKIEMIRTKIMIRQSALSASNNRETAARYAR